MRRTTKGAPPDESTSSGRIRKARTDAKLTQRELGERTFTSQVTVSEWEVGRTEPNLTQYRAIASATGVDVSWLLFGREPADSDSLSGIAAEAQKQNRHFVWTFQETARMFLEEGVKADFLSVLAFVQKLLGVVESGADETTAREAIARKLETERAEIRKGFEEVIKKRL
jgi:transcriptional regulator with XRE-family HTH domain